MTGLQLYIKNALNVMVIDVLSLSDSTTMNVQVDRLLCKVRRSCNIKICISSSSWLVFEDAFQQGPSQLLEGLIFPDIATYIPRFPTAMERNEGPGAGYVLPGWGNSREKKVSIVEDIPSLAQRTQ
jgi:hypothetical protein